MANDASTGAEGLQETMVTDSVDESVEESSLRDFDATDFGATTAPPSHSGLQSCWAMREVAEQVRRVAET
jgi:hypothetical protein